MPANTRVLVLALVSLFATPAGCRCHRNRGTGNPAAAVHPSCVAGPAPSVVVTGNQVARGRRVTVAQAPDSDRKG